MHSGLGLGRGLHSITHVVNHVRNLGMNESLHADRGSQCTLGMNAWGVIDTYS